MAESDEIPVLTTEIFEDIVLKSSKPVLVFCYLKDSGLCSIKYEEFKRAAKKYVDKMKFLRLDIGRSKDLAFEHRVMAVPAMLCFINGEATDRWANIAYEDRIETLMERTLGSRFDRLPEGIIHVKEDNYKTVVQDSSLVYILNFWKSDHEPSWLLLPELVDIADKHKGKLRVGVVNFDGNRDLATQFRVSHVPTMIFLRKGEVAERLPGLQSRYVVEKVIRSLVEDR